jgi:Skp family chaperone for outer membrane proteins
VDAIVTALIGSAPQLGIAGILLALLGLLMRRETQLHAEYRMRVAELTKNYANELARINRDHDAELGELRADIAGLRAALDDLNTKLDAERERRRAAEDSAMGRLQMREQGDPPWR